MEATVNRAQLEVAAIELDTLIDEIGQFMSRYPEMPDSALRALARAMADVGMARSQVIDAAEPMGGWEPRS